MLSRKLSPPSVGENRPFLAMAWGVEKDRRVQARSGERSNLCLEKGSPRRHGLLTMTLLFSYSSTLWMRWSAAESAHCSSLASDNAFRSVRHNDLHAAVLLTPCLGIV